MESNLKRQDLTYNFLWKLKDEDLSLAFCLAEFIDNSISSCEQTYWDKNINHNLVITITYNSEDNKYIIEDNAGGMDNNELDYAMRIDKNFNYDVDNSYKNQYGIGMKSAIFWIGHDGEIYTKKDEIEICGKYHTNGKKDNDPVEYGIYESNGVIDKKSGTKIFIDKCYENDRTMTKNKWEYVSYFLGNRYSKYLIDDYENESGLYKCKIIINSDLFDEENNSKVVKKITVKNDDGVFKYIESNSKKNKHDVEELLENKFRDELKNNYSYVQFKEKLLDEKLLEFDDSITLNNGLYKSPVKVYILSKPSQNLGGVAIIHSKRYIFHPVKMEKERKLGLGGLYLPFKEKDFQGLWRWVRVELKLEEIESNEKCKKIKPEKNKKKIIFDSNSDIKENSFNVALSELFDKWTKYAEIVREITSDDRRKEDTKKLENRKNKMEYNDKTNNLETEFTFINSNEKIKVEISAYDSKDPNALISFIEKIDDNSGLLLYKYQYNNSNEYFNKVDPTRMSYTLRLLLYLDIYYNQNKNIYDKSISEVIKDALKFFKEN